MSAEEFINTIYYSDCTRDILTHIIELHNFIDSIKLTHREYYDWLDDADFNDAEELLQLMIQAPTLEIKYWLMGKMDLQRDYFINRVRKGARNVVS